MFGLDTVKVGIVAGLVMAVLVAGYSIYHGIQAAAVSKIQLQQARAEAQAQHDQDQRTIAALQATAALSARLAVQVAQLKASLDAAPVSRSCLTSPAGRVFAGWVRSTGGHPGSGHKAAAVSVAVPPATGVSK